MSATTMRRGSFGAELRGWLWPGPLMLHMARVVLALSLALYAAYVLQLESPGSAATTVLIVANTSRGAVISKSVWRIIGSIVGAIAAVVLIAGFVQAPVLFVLSLALWIGVCTCVSSAFRYNRGYAAVLAGYTVALVAFGAISEPQRIFDLAVGRLAVVSVGVLSAGLVFMLTDVGPASDQLQRRLLQLIGTTSGVVAAAFRTPDLIGPRTTRSAVAADLLALDQMIEFASAEDAGLGRYAGDLRVASAHLYSALLGGLRMASLLRDLRPSADREVAERVEGFLQWVAGLDPATPAMTIVARIGEVEAMIHAAAAATDDLPALSAFDQALVLMHQLREATGSLDSLQTGRPRAARTPLRDYVNWRVAFRNGARAAMAVALAGLFWIVSQWPNGASTLVLLGPLCGLLALNDSAAAAAKEFGKGIFLAVVAAFFCTFGILPQMSGYVLLLVGVLPFIVLGLWLGSVPKYAGMAGGFLIFFSALTAPTNPMVFDLAASLNGDFGTLIGALCAILTFTIVLPPEPIAEARAIARSLRAAVLELPGRSALAFEHVQHQKLLRLSRRLAERPDVRFQAVGEATVAMLIARQLAILRRAGVDAALGVKVRAIVTRVLADAPAILRDPALFAGRAARGAAELLLIAEATPQRRLAAAMQELGALVEMDVAFLRGGGVLAA